MKRKFNITGILALSLLVLVAVSSCKKKKSDPEPETTATPQPQTNGTMTAVLNGSNWTSVKNSAELLIDDDQQISAFALNGETSANLFVFGFDIPDANPNLLVDTHDEGLAKDDAVMVYAIKTSGGGTLIQHMIDEATFNITAVDNASKKASGTFTLKAHKIGSTASADSIKITNGVFTNVAFTVRHQ
jgi:hypothetical protein